MSSVSGQMAKFLRAYNTTVDVRTVHVRDAYNKTTYWPVIHVVAGTHTPLAANGAHGYRVGQQALSPAWR